MPASSTGPYLDRTTAASVSAILPQRDSGPITHIPLEKLWRILLVGHSQMSTTLLTKSIVSESMVFAIPMIKTDAQRERTLIQIAGFRDALKGVDRGPGKRSVAIQ